MKNLQNLLLAIGLLLLQTNQAQNITQTIRGSVSDKQAQFFLPGASVILLNQESPKGAVTDANGKFRISEVKPGKYDIKVKWWYRQIRKTKLIMN
jgi:hypothetical protein